MSEMAHALTPVIILLAAGLAAILLARPLKLSPIVGFVVAGMALGPHGAGVIADSEATHLLAELGVVFLLFELGMQFTLNTLRENRDIMLVMGPIQMLLTAAVFAVGAVLLGAPISAAIAIGGALAISSTAVLARVLADRNQLTCPVGRAAISLSVFQDVMAIFLLIYGVSLSASASGAAGGNVLMDLGVAAGKAAIGFVIAFTVAPLILTPLFAALARTRNEEAFTAVALLLVLSLAGLASAVGLSTTLGAFLGGLMIAATPYRHVIETEAKPFRGLFLGFFFFTVGMMVDLSVLAAAWPAVIGVALAIMLVKTACAWVAARAAGWSTPGSLQLGAVVSQGSEFGFVILALPAVSGALAPAQNSVLIAAIVLTLALTPIVSFLGMSAGRKLARARAQTSTAAPSAASAAATEAPVLVVGMSIIGRRAVDALKANGTPVVALERDPAKFTGAVADGYDVSFGDPADLRLMETAGVGTARALVLTEPRLEVSTAVAAVVRDKYPTLVRFAAVQDQAEADRYAALGMRPVVSREEPAGIELAEALLAFVSAAPGDIEAWSAAERRRASATPDGLVGALTGGKDAASLAA